MKKNNWITFVVFDATNNQTVTTLFRYPPLQARQASHSVREDRVRSLGQPRGAGDWSRPHLSPPASRPRGHARCNSSDGNASVHQQWSAQGGGPLHHPLRSSDRGSDWRGWGPAEGEGENRYYLFDYHILMVTGCKFPVAEWTTA